MLSAAFLDWWFAPWRYASSTHASQDADLVGRRDAYRLWCAGVSVRPALPHAFDATWQAAALENGHVLTASAKLFGGLFAARHQQREALAQLAMADRKWCASIASVQPLSMVNVAPYASDEMLVVRGLTELSCRAEQAFPGMWSRLKLLLPPEIEHRVTTLLAQRGDANALPANDSQRALRCWQICRQRAGDMNRASFINSD